MDPLMVAVVLVAAIVIVFFVRWLMSDSSDAQETQLPDDPAVLTEIERLRQKPPGPVV
jgi:hypothetical protein